MCIRDSYRTDEVKTTYSAADKFPAGIMWKTNGTIEVITDSDILSLGRESYTEIYQHINDSLDMFCLLYTSGLGLTMQGLLTVWLAAG